MAKNTTPKPISLGVCAFCQEKIAKNRFTQHLKTCKARLQRQAEQQGENQRLFHLQIEGKYRPEYWMHLEIPTTATLADLDGFLRFIWLECCGHLSEFKIDGESYSSTPDDWDMGMGGIVLVDENGHPLETPHLVEEEEDEEEEDEDEEEEDEELPGPAEIATEMAKQLTLEFQTDLKNVPVSQIEKRLQSLFTENLPAGIPTEMLPMLQPLLHSMAESLHQGTLAEDLTMEDEDEDEGGFYSELGEVLDVGDTFSYVYDFGSSSTLSLRVLAEREGVVPVFEMDEDEEEDEHEHYDHHDHDHDHEDEDEDEKIAILVMGRNEAPVVPCRVCGQPATRVPSSSEYQGLAEIALCDTHAAQEEYPEELLPIVNSPRTGICGYAGDEEGEEWDFEEDDESEEDEEE